MEREITRNDFGQIVSYEITSSNLTSSSLKYGKVFLEPFVEKFDEDSYNDEYPLPQKDEFELLFNPVVTSFNVTQVSFPSIQFKYASTNNGFNTHGIPSPSPNQNPPSGSFPLYGTLNGSLAMSPMVHWQGYANYLINLGSGSAAQECFELRRLTVNRNVVGYANKPVNQLVVGDIIYDRPHNLPPASSNSQPEPLRLPTGLYYVYTYLKSGLPLSSSKIITFSTQQAGRIFTTFNC